MEIVNIFRQLNIERLGFHDPRFLSFKKKKRAFVSVASVEIVGGIKAAEVLLSRPLAVDDLRLPLMVPDS